MGDGNKDNGEMMKNIEINIVGNEVANMYMPYINFRNDFKSSS